MPKSATGCPSPKGSEDYGKRGTAWKPMVLISIACLGATTAISLSLIIQHLRRYRAPREQRQIIRICFSVIVYSLVAFFEIYRYDIAQYIDPIGDIYESFGLCALFLLFIQYAAPESTTFNDETFATVKAAEETETIFNWPKVSWIFVFQYPIVEILCVILQEITEASGRYCLNSLSPKYAHVWVEVIETLSIGPCVFAILAFRSHLLRLMRMKRALGKIISFKIIVFIRFVQTWAFSLLLEYHVIKPSSTYSYNDILYGIPAVLTCAEMVIFSLGFWYAFSSSEYSSKAKPHAQPLSLWSATLHALNPWDLISGIGKIFPFARELSQTGDWTKWRAVQVEAVKSSIKGGGLVGKGIRKYKNRKGPSQGRYQELDEGVEPLTRPIESHHQDGASYPMGGLSGSAMYQPPEGSPWDEPKSYLTAGTSPNGRSRSSSQSYLAAAQAPPGRPRASSQSSLMMESSDPGRLQEWNGLRYDRTPSPSEGGGYFNERTQGRDTVDM